MDIDKPITFKIIHYYRAESKDLAYSIKAVDDRFSEHNLSNITNGLFYAMAQITSDLGRHGLGTNFIIEDADKWVMG